VARVVGGHWSVGDGVRMSREEFEEAVADALDSIPPELTRQMVNVVLLVEDDPPAGQSLLGLYRGVPLTARGDGWAGALPDQITIFRNPILAMCRSRSDVVREVRVTVLHEVAHHFGISDARLHELGWG
jgi:predicted Zn-dependent protease with MMP-like domain